MGDRPHALERSSPYSWRCGRNGTAGPLPPIPPPMVGGAPPSLIAVRGAPPMSSISLSAHLPLAATRRSLLSRCRLAGGLLGAASLALVAISPSAHVSAAGSNGIFVFGARVCSSPE